MTLLNVPAGLSGAARRWIVAGAIFAGLSAISSARGDEAEPGVGAVVPDAKARTSAAVVVSGSLNLAHTAQLLPIDAAGAVAAPKAGRDVSPVDAQCEAVLDRLEAALKEAGTGVDRLVKINVYVARADVLPSFRAAVARRIIGSGRPAMTVVVSALSHPDALVAADGVAVTPLPKPVAPPQNAAGGGRARVAILPAGARVYVSGQAAQSTDLAEATRKTLDELGQTLTFVGLQKSSVVQLKAFLEPASGAAAVERELDAFFGAGAVPPVVFVDWRSSKKVPIEIELIAAAGRREQGPKVEYLTPPALKPSPVFSRVVRVNRGDIIYVSGLFGAAGTTGTGQVEAIFGELKDVLAKSRSDLGHMVKATYYVSDDDASKALNELRPRYYDPKTPPAASKAVVKDVGLEGRTITLDMIAVPK